MNEATLLAEIRRTHRLILSFNTTHLLSQELIMQELDELRASVGTLKAQAVEAKSDSARHEARTTAAVGLLQALTAKIAELASQPTGASAAELAELNASAQEAIADFNAADAQRDTADAVLETGTAENTPADPAP
jgi:hypothetical protein